MIFSKMSNGLNCLEEGPNYIYRTQLLLNTSLLNKGRLLLYIYIYIYTRLLGVCHKDLHETCGIVHQFRFK